MTRCPICWVRRRIRSARARVVTELRLVDGSILRTDLSMREHRSGYFSWPKDSKFVFSAVVYGRRAARRVTAEALRRETGNWVRSVQR